MKRCAIVCAVLGLAVALAAGQARGALDAEIAAILRDRLLAKATVGIRLVRLGDGGAAAEVLYAHNDTAPLIPASNMKLLTTAAALERLGPTFTFRTLLVQHEEDLVLIGDGDPSLGDAEYLGRLKRQPLEVFADWAGRLKQAGLTSFRRLVVDDSIFDETLVHPQWDARHLNNRYCAQIAGLTFNAGCVDFQVRGGRPGQAVHYTMVPPTAYVTVRNSCITGGENAVVLERAPGSNEIVLRGTAPADNAAAVSVPVHDPAMYAGTVLAETLAGAGIKVGGVVRDRTLRSALLGRRAEGRFRLLAVHETPIAQVLARCNKDSMNMYAESLAKRLGAVASGGAGSWDSFAAAAGDYLSRIGVAPERCRISDGSGLSRQNLLTAEAICRILEHCYSGPNREVFMNSLAVPGHEGTLEKRFAGSDLRQRVMAKSGYINQVSALSGYLKGRDDRWYAFSILMNGLPPMSNTQAKALQESIVRALDGATRGTGAGGPAGSRGRRSPGG